MELLIGARSRKETQSFNNLFKLYKIKNRIIVPSSEIYMEAGKVASKMTREFGYDLKKSFGLSNDILIALSAQRVGATVFTQNRKDFEAINKLKRISFQIL
jgi:predicted nucleic acid-binding protein